VRPGSRPAGVRTGWPIPGSRRLQTHDAIRVRPCIETGHRATGFRRVRPSLTDSSGRDRLHSGAHEARVGAGTEDSPCRQAFIPAQLRARFKGGLEPVVLWWSRRDFGCARTDFWRFAGPWWFHGPRNGRNMDRTGGFAARPTKARQTPGAATRQTAGRSGAASCGASCRPWHRFAAQRAPVLHRHPPPPGE